MEGGILREMPESQSHASRASLADSGHPASSTGEDAAIAGAVDEANGGEPVIAGGAQENAAEAALVAPAIEARRALWRWGAGAVLVVAALVYLLGPILLPFLFGAILAYIGSPIVAALAKRRVPRAVGALLVVAGMIAVIVALVLILTPMVQTEAATIARRLPELADRISQRVVPALHERFGIDVQFDAESLRALIAENVSGIQNIGVWLLGSLRIGGIAVVGFLANLLLTPVVMFYLLTDWNTLTARLGALLPRRWDLRARRIVGEIDSVLAEYLRGQITVMLTLAVFYALALWAAGLQFAVPIGVLTGLLIFVPYLGFGIGLLLALLVALLQYSSAQGVLIVLGIYGVGQLLEGFVLTPFLVGERIGLHPLAVIFALLAFGQLFGFTGVLLALPASAAILVALRHLRAAYTASPLYRDP
jgi:predicted PurR-regulated permease PerM